MDAQLVIRPTQWANLPDIGDVPKITDSDYAVLNEIKDVLAKHNALGRFGVNLLHRHFDIRDDEILVEYTDELSRTQTIKVELLSDINTNDGCIETNWTFDREDASVACRGVCVYNQGHRRQHG
ncbi:hypothetical protein [Methylobacterium sp. J-077]|uniref:hypothetical protein n=1 Tax=Methylobacterium sp. J-077 TaxID=2836656 RepID=UPI001FBAD436|nr:hypothetical protein [Methylobacterium sp. J-077]MCJ2121369.1 hypothetical protein [Methylobacterium sp. J-077]